MKIHKISAKELTFKQVNEILTKGYKLELSADAVKRIQNSLVLEAVAKAENIQISDERLDEEIAKMAESYKMEPDKLKDLMGDFEKEQMKNDLAVQAAADLVRDAAVEVPRKEEA